jgi:L-asparaginase
MGHSLRYYNFMSPVVYDGCYDIKDLQKSEFITILHGGAGPADPKVGQINETADDIKKILSDLAINKLVLSFVKSPLKLTTAEIATLQAAKMLENNPRFNAGIGAALQEDGKARVSASFMESTRTKFSSVSNASNVQNPSELAYYLQSLQFCMLDQMGSDNLSKQLKVPMVNLVTEYRRKRWLAMQNYKPKLGHGTIGAVTTDSKLNFAACTSTGGVGNETAGRIGDTPTVAGNYCNEQVGISCTGIGEHIVNEAFAAKTAARVLDGLSLRQAMLKGLEEASRKKRKFAAIGLEYDKVDRKLHWVAATNNKYFVWGIYTPQKNIVFTDFL